MIFVAVIYSLFSTILSTAQPNNYLTYSRSKYSEEIFLTIRKIEKLSIKLQKAKCDLEFIRLCIIYKLTPTFLKINLWKKRMKNTNEFSVFKNACLKKEFQNRHNDNIKLTEQINILIKFIQTKFTHSDFLSLQKYLYEISKKTQDKFTNIHHSKLIKLNKGPIGQNYNSLKSKLIHNISSYNLTPAEERLLCRGWDFCIENKINNFIDFKTDIEINSQKFQRHCHPNTFSNICRNIYNYSEIFMKTIKKKKIRNISDEEFNALKSLKNNKEIIISKADKGNSIVILDRKDYISKMNNILQLKQFQSTKHSTLTEKEKSMNKYISKLYKEEIINKETYWYIHSTSSNNATMYGQPKTHKPNYPLRPIISSIGSYNHNLSKYLYQLIKNNLPNKSCSYVKDSFDFVKKITEIKNSSKHTMISFDVDNLYTNVPVHEAIQITLDILYKKNNPALIPFSRAQLKQLLEFAVCNTPFRFFDKTFIQIDGVAMGSPLGPILADVFMSNLELKLNRFTTNKPILWIRYVDDVFCIFNNTQNIKDFLRRINNWHLSINFTHEDEQKEKLAFLDVLIHRDGINNDYKTTLYRKPTNTNLYLLYESNQCREYKLSLIRTLVIRIHRICSTNDFKNEEIKLMKETLTNNGYPSHLIRRGIREGEIIVKNKNKNNQQNIQTPNQLVTEKVFFLLPYYGEESTILANKIKHLCKKLLPLIQVKTCFKKTFTIKSNFLPLQKGMDESKKEKKLVYKLSCQNCNKCYVGETNREKKVRMKEHQTDIKKFTESSNVAKHANTEKHIFDFDNSETLALETNWKCRTVKESLLTYELQDKALNDVKFKLNVFK